MHPRKRFDSYISSGGTVGGGGGGKPDSAMAGAKDASKADEALAAVDSIVSAMLK